MRMTFKSIKFNNHHQILKQTECDFIFLFQRAVLLGLKEDGRLNEMQHRQAEATLLEQHREYIRGHAELLSDD